MNYLISATCLLFSAFLFIDVSAQNDCIIAPQSAQLDINNASVTYSTSGNQWNNNGPGYIIPKGDGIGSVYSGHPFIGGYDDDENLHVSVGNLYNDPTSFRPGPLNTDSEGNLVTLNCNDFNVIYKINRSEVILHRLYFQMMEDNGGEPPTDPPFENGYNIPEDILNWPAHAEVNPGEPQALAPFFEDDCCGGTPGIYEPELGDYPAFEFDDNSEEFDCEKHLLGDQVLWWVMNDATGFTILDDQLGIEIHNMAYAYLSEGHLNNATFLRRTIINRSENNYSEVYYGERIDGDLGNYDDDFFGTDVDRGMAYYYNGDLNDENNQGILGYGVSPPAIGFTWVGGPLAENDGIDNNYNGEVDEPGERLRMDFANLQTGIPSPFSLDHFYNMLSGSFQNGDLFVYEDQDNNQIPYKMVYPGDSDPLLLNTFGIPVDPWTEITEGNFSADRKHWMSSGPFSFESNDEISYTMAITWARDLDCDEIPCSVDMLQEATDEVQGIHNECYEIPCTVLDASFDVSIENGYASFSSPITSGVQYTWTFGDGNELTTDIPFATHTYDSPDNIEVCLEIDFGCGTSSTCQSIGGLLADLMLGPELTQIEGVGNTNNYMALTDETIAAILENDSSMVLHPTYKPGMGPVKVHIYNLDNIVEGDYVLEFDGTEAESNWKMYIVGTTDTIYSEVPIGTPNAQFIEDWGMMVSTDAHLSAGESMPIGASLQFADDGEPWLSHLSDTDDFTYQNWIREGTADFNCIGEGGGNCYYIDEEQTQLDLCLFNDRDYSTPDESFEKVINGGWAPSHFVPHYFCHPRLNGGQYSGQLYNVPGQVRNIDLVLTADKSLWTRCPVLDLRYGENANFTVPLRDTLSVDKNGLNQNHPDCNVDEATLNGQQVDEDDMSYGMGWFPGYAIDVNTGKRLNIVFGENPDLEDDHGNDMIWNPTGTISEAGDIANFGGMHSITILSNHEVTPMLAQYDYGTSIAEYINSPVPPMYRGFQRQQQWTGLPLLNEGFELLPIEEGLIPTETTIQLRLLHRYQNYLPDAVNINNGNPLYNFTIEYEDLISSVEEIAQHQVNLYPNPSKEQLNIQLSGFERQVIEGRIHNLSGQVVKVVQLNGSGINTLDVSGLKSGMYILRLHDESQSSTQFSRFVIAR